MARSRLTPVVIAAAVLAIVAVSAPVSGQEWLTNGGFESGTAGWDVHLGDAFDCVAHEGNGALGVTAASGGTTILRQNVEGALPAGEYTISGWTRVHDGQAEVGLIMAFNRPVGPPAGIHVPEPVVTGSNYTQFSFTRTANFAPESVLVALHVTTDSTAEVCFDSIQLTTPGGPPTVTPEPSATEEPEATATPTATAEPASDGTQVATPSASSTATTTPTPTPSATAGPTFAFTNGGFEAGLSGWSKYGGELTTTSSALSGAVAGLLTSATQSTKWAYQAVAIDAPQYYEFSGHVAADAGVREAYLRISWYPTPDASGPAMSTTDSLDRVAGPSEGFVFLTTGPVQPPAGAASARVRVLLAPHGDDTSSIRIDDVSFGVTAAPSPTPPPTATPVPTSMPSPTPPAPLASGLIATPVRDDAPDAAPQERREHAAAEVQNAPVQAEDIEAATPVAEVGAARIEAGASAEPLRERPPDAFASPAEPEDELPWAWLAGVALVVVGLAGVYLQSRQTPR